MTLSPSSGSINKTRQTRYQRPSESASLKRDIGSAQPHTVLDRMIHAGAARLTGGVSMIGLGLAWFDWASHLATAPGRQIELVQCAAIETMRALDHVATDLRRSGDGSQASTNLASDRRFHSTNWHQAPFSIYARNFRAMERWWDQAASVHGVSDRHQALIAFIARQMLDIVAPSNFLATNPDILEQTLKTRGTNLVNGAMNAFDDTLRLLSDKKPSGADTFKVGIDVAASDGKVVTRTRLAEIIQYSPKTAQVHSEPVVIIPAWIMKYYILDLSPHNSLVRYLTEQGFTVFMVSWKNPGPEDRNLSLDDYRQDGVIAAFDAASAITGARNLHATGYCLGGTLLAITAAAMARDGDTRLKTVSLFASQVDFHEAGELRLFINESQLALVEDMMWMRGYLQSAQMAGAFHILRSNDLIWSRMINNYFMGERERPIDIMVWSEDTTRMPYRMHAEYLRKLYLENQFAEGRLNVDGRPVVVRDVDVPMFVVGTEWDHVAPWRSVFKIHLEVENEITFVLTTGGHNAGIVSEPGHAGRSYRIASRAARAPYVDPDTWVETARPVDGSWWPAWAHWLVAYNAEMSSPPPVGRAESGYPPLEEAPGTYVHG